MCSETLNGKIVESVRAKRDAESASCDNAADAVRAVIISDISQGLKTFIPNILISAMQFTEFIKEEDNILS
jgi:hypothetical protein